jgi:glycosyltransferase involved in cell wall biosynthesis
MKIAMTHVDLPNEFKAGVANQAHYLANALVDRGHQVTMFTFSPAYSECRYQVHQYPKFPSFLSKFKAFLFAGQLTKTDFSNFDILHTHGDSYLLWGRHPHLRTFHGAAQDEARTAVRLRRRVYQTVMIGLEQLNAQVADLSVGVSQATQDRIPAVSSIIPCGVNIHQFRPGVKSAHPTVLFVGTKTGRKRGSLLAEIFTNEIRPAIPNAEFWTVADQPMEGEGIINFGKVSLEKLAELYQRAWVFCMPSLYEGFGVPYVEAMASGTAVVASPNPGAKEVLAGGEYGILAKDATLGTHINRLLQDQELRERYEQQGLLRAQDFSWESVVQRYETLYQQLIDRFSHH